MRPIQKLGAPWGLCPRCRRVLQRNEIKCPKCGTKIDRNLAGYPDNEFQG